MAALDDLVAALYEYRVRHRWGAATIAVGAAVALDVRTDKRSRGVLTESSTGSTLWGLAFRVDELLDSHAFEIRGPVLAGVLGDGVPA